MATTPRPLADYFADLRDPRIRLKCRHDFMAIILIVVCATIAGADDFVGMAAFAKAKEDWFRDRLGLKLDNGIPSHDTLNRVFATIDPAAVPAVLPRLGRVDVGPPEAQADPDRREGHAGVQAEDRGRLSDGADRQRVGVGERRHAGPGADRREVQRDHRDPGTAARCSTFPGRW